MSPEAGVGLSSSACLLAIVALDGVAAGRASGGLSGFFLGGREMNRVVVALSAVDSGHSGWLLLGFTGVAWTRGVGAVSAVVGYTAAELLPFLLYAPRLHAFTCARDRIPGLDFPAARVGESRGPRCILPVMPAMQGAT